MAAPHLKSIKIKNYRVFSDFEIGSFRRLNLIAGTNGTGKTTLLEAIFFLMDRGNVISLMRPLQWRNLPPTLSFAKEMLFSDQSSSQLSIRGQTRDGAVEVNYTWEAQRLPANQVTNLKSPPVNSQLHQQHAEAESAMQGFTVEVKNDNIVRLRRGMIPSADGMQVTDFESNPERLITAVILSRYTMNFAGDVTQRYSEIARRGEKSRVVDVARRINPEIEDLELFQVGPAALLHTRLRKGQLVPISLAGDGVVTMLSIGLAIMNARNGAVILDEFDAAIHYSALPEMWRFISELSREYDCQVFAATHSRECIEAAVKGAAQNNAVGDLAYYRLDKIGPQVMATHYDSKELLQANSSGWEVR